MELLKLLHVVLVMALPNLPHVVLVMALLKLLHVVLMMYWYYLQRQVHFFHCSDIFFWKF